MVTIRAIYKNGVVRPLEPVDLLDGTELMCEARFVRVVPDSQIGEIYENLDRRRRDAGQTETATRNNEHQP